MYRNTIRIIGLLILSNFFYKCETSKRKVVKEYYPNGQIRIEKEVKNDKIPDGYIKAFYPNGGLKTLGQNNYGKWTGLFEFYDENGKIREKTEYLENKKNGYAMRYNPDGSLKMNLTFLNDLKNGKSVFYDSLGKVVEVDIFESGRLLRATTYSSDGSIESDKWSVEIKSISDSIKVGSIFKAEVKLYNQNSLKNLTFQGGSVPGAIFLDKNQRMSIYKQGANYSKEPYKGYYHYEEKMINPGEYYFSGAVTFNDSAGKNNWSEFSHRFVVYP